MKEVHNGGKAMNRIKGVMALMGLLLLIAATIYPSPQQTPSDNVLARQVKGVHLASVTTAQAAVNALITAGAPGGITVTYDCNQPASFTFSPADSSLRGALESIVTTDPKYVWEVKRSVINLVPRNGEPRLLKVRVSKLQIIGAKTVNEGLDQLLATPEVRKLNLGRRFVQGGVYRFNPQNPTPKVGRKISLSLRNVTVREALNAIARAHGNAVWILTQGECDGRNLFSIDFVSR